MTQHPKCSHGLCVLSSFSYYLHSLSGCRLKLQQILQVMKIFPAALRKLEVISKLPWEEEESFNLEIAVWFSSFTDSFCLVSSAGVPFFTCPLNISVTQDCVLIPSLCSLWVTASIPLLELSLGYRRGPILYLHYAAHISFCTSDICTWMSHIATL